MASSPSWLMTSFNWLFMHDIVSMWSWVHWSPTPGNRSPSSWEQTAEVPTSRLRGRWARYGTELNLMHDILMCRLLCICIYIYIYIHTHTHIYITRDISKYKCSYSFAWHPWRVPGKHSVPGILHGQDVSDYPAGIGAASPYCSASSVWSSGKFIRFSFMAACVLQALNCRRRASFIT